MVTKTTNKKMYGDLIKAIVAIVVGIAVAAGMVACDNDNGGKDKDPDPCNCPDKAHLGDGENCACGGGACDCTEQKAVVAGTTIPITKQTGVTVAQMNAAVTNINSAYATFDELEKEVFASNVTKINIVSGNEVSFTSGVFKVGYEAEDWKIAGYAPIAKIQPQTKSTWLADKGNKEREWVAELMNDRITSVNGNAMMAAT